MTLMELVVGLTVAGAALAAGYAALGTAVDRRSQAAAAVAAVARAAAERRLVVEWLAGARLTPDEGGQPFRGLDGSFRDLADDELTFETAAGTGGEPGPAVVRLFVDRDTATTERGLTAELSSWGQRGGSRVEIEPGVASLDLRYYTRMLGGSEWLPSWISTTVLPAAVEVSLGPAPGDTLPPLLRPAILVPLGNQR